jgi:murein L,D-transpeptidase YafK
VYQKTGQGLKYAADYYVTIGKNGAGKNVEGDKRTPLGLYFAGSKLKQPLDDFYGDGAYPLNYPNELDQRHNRSGSGIWLHGNTPVIIVDSEVWQTGEHAQDDTKESLLAELEAWRKDWVSQNTDAYLSHYSRQFFYSDGNLQRWADYKRSIQANKPKVSISLDHVSMFAYPASAQNNAQQIVVVNFEQDFRSSSLQNKMRKRQYWVYENKQWKILYEGAA